MRVFRGGAYGFMADECVISNLDGVPRTDVRMMRPDWGHDDRGFRLLVTVEQR